MIAGDPRAWAWKRSVDAMTDVAEWMEKYGSYARDDDWRPVWLALYAARTMALLAATSEDVAEGYVKLQRQEKAADKSLREFLDAFDKDEEGAP